MPRFTIEDLAIAKPTTPEQNEQAFLKVLRFCEFGRVDDRDYYAVYGFGTFTDDSTHPNQRFTVGKHKDGTPVITTAAGAYQIVYSTYASAVRAGVVADFKPASQDKIALWIIGQSHALDFIDHGQVAPAIAKLTTQWVSLPGGSHPKITLASALSMFESNLQADAGGR